MKIFLKSIRAGSFRNSLLAAAICLVLLLFALNAQRYMQIFLDGTTLWLVCVFSSSLFFLFLTALLTATGAFERLSKLSSPLCRRLFSLSGISGYCLLLSLLCGYPVGAKTIADLYETGRISRTESTKISVVASSSGPIFIVGSVGSGMFSSPKIGAILLTAHLLAVLLFGMTLRFFPKTKQSDIAVRPLEKQTGNLLYDSMYSAVLSVLVVGGFIAVFYTFSVLAEDFRLLFPLAKLLETSGMPPAYAAGFTKGLIEMTGGCSALARDVTPLSVSLCAALITFGGVSVLVQQICYLQKAKVNLPLFLTAKCLQSLLAFFLCFGLCLLFL